MKCKFYILVALILFLTQCSSSTENIRKVHGVASVNGDRVHYQTTSITAIHWFGFYPLYNDATIPNTVSTFMKEAAGKKAKKVSIIQRDETKWYLLYPPFSFIITPVTSEVFGEVHE